VTADDIAARHDAERHRYELVDGDRVIGQTRYRPFGARTRIFFHTEVDDAYEGQGLGSRLAAYALRDTAAAGAEVVLVCPFMKAYVTRHPGLAEVVEARPEHLRAIDGRRPA
jgi:predicted GNAT family acetyltransferase